MAANKGLPLRAATDGESVSGKFTGTVQLSSGKFAVVETSHEFTLVPWRSVIDRQLGREVIGVVQGGIGVVAVGAGKRIGFVGSSTLNVRPSPTRCECWPMRVRFALPHIDRGLPQSSPDWFPSI